MEVTLVMICDSKFGVYSICKKYAAFDHVMFSKNLEYHGSHLKYLFNFWVGGFNHRTVID